MLAYFGLSSSFGSQDAKWLLLLGIKIISSMSWNLTIMEWSQRPLATSQFKCQLFPASADSVRYNHFHLCLLLNMRIFALAFYSKAGTMINGKWKYKSEIAWNDWTIIRFPTVTWLCMGVPLSFEVQILNHNIPVDAWHQMGHDKIMLGQNKLRHLTCPWLWPYLQANFSARTLLIWSWQHGSQRNKISNNFLDRWALIGRASVS